MISEKFECVFIHIPKTAGQSIEHFFLKLHGLSWKERSPLLLKYNPDPLKGPERLAHLKAKEYTSYGYLDNDRFNRYFKFTFVRNPWARLVSEFNYFHYQQKMSFEEFVTKGLPAKSDYSDEYRHITPQYDFLYGDSGDCLVDFIGRFENFQTDFDAICSKLGIENSRLPHVNSSSEKKSLKGLLRRCAGLKKPQKRYPYTEYYNEKTKRIIETIYYKDIEHFNYTFGS